MSEEALAAVFTATGEPLRLEHYPLPTLSAGEVLVRITCCTICGSDVHTYEGRRTTPVPTILGHEIMGTVAELPPGEAVTDVAGHPLAVGDRITWSIAANCGDCFFCEHEIPPKCEKLFKYGHEAIDDVHPLSGGLAEYCHLAAGTPIVRVPAELPDAVACPANCATATVAGALRVGNVGPGKVTLIQGAGMLGLSAIAMARWRGATEVIACDIDPERLELAPQFGATKCVLVQNSIDELTEVVAETTGGRGVDVAIELSGAPSSVAAGLKLLRIGGTYVLIGSVYPAADVPVSAEWVVRRWLNIHGVHNYLPEDLATAIEFLTSEHARYPLAELVTATFPLESAEEAFAHTIRERAHRVAVVPK
ncbi:MAG: alcohol dehydrogenase [Planctomycetota bacterium]|nr:MAG: alcohol dehydrogenase [Planctomycetota bacterium]REJ95891.1 MAG: alcohol dehydrogenase [Planctomycetota bacterium]REK25279.1 MAG: alcohol dehydrogenase [Planctomycetota bacterium]REK37991.1 MAG: alcohol dehydrogenase [Planctomycetota bacterium]